MISGIATPTVWPSPRKLVTRTSLSGFFITVNALVVVPTLPSLAGPLTVTVYLVPQDSALAGFQTRAVLSRLPSTSSPSAFFTETLVPDGSSLLSLTSVSASTPVASACGEVTATVLCGGSGDAGVAALPPSPCDPPRQDGDLSPLHPAPSNTTPAASAATTVRQRPRPPRPVSRVAPIDRVELVTMSPHRMSSRGPSSVMNAGPTNPGFVPHTS
jgi:hypothetical protein